jgi:hypothetical protein
MSAELIESFSLRVAVYCSVSNHLSLRSYDLNEVTDYNSSYHHDL